MTFQCKNYKNSHANFMSTQSFEPIYASSNNCKKSKIDHICHCENNNLEKSNIFVYPIIPTIVSVNKNEYQPISYFSWIKSEFSSWVSYILIDVEILDSVLDVQIVDKTNKTILGSRSDIKSSGLYKIPYSNPKTNARLTFEVKKEINSHSDPIIYSALNICKKI